MNKKIITTFSIFLLILIFMPTLAEAASCCCYADSKGLCKDCALASGSVCYEDYCSKKSVAGCSSSNCGSSTVCGYDTYYCCYTGSAYTWQSSSCSISCPSGTTTTTVPPTTTSSSTTTTTPSTTTTTIPTTTTTRPPIVTHLGQSVSPSPGTYGTSSSFYCDYTYDEPGGATAEVPSATCYVKIDGTDYTATPQYIGGELALYRYQTSSLSIATHTWYCRCSKTGYQSQTGSSQNYIINPVSTTTSSTTTTTTTTSTTTTTTLPTSCQSSEFCIDSGTNCVLQCGGSSNVETAYSISPNTCNQYGSSICCKCKITTTTSTTTTTTTTTVPNCGQYATPTACGIAGCYWCNGVCQSSSCPTTTTTSTTTTTTLPSGQCSLGQCGPCEKCGGITVLNCGYCQRCTLDAFGLYTCALCDTRTGQTCPSPACPGDWKCDSGVCQILDPNEHCKNVIAYQKGNCANTNFDIIGECEYDDYAQANLVNQGYWTQKITDYHCAGTGRNLWCYNVKGCQNVCGGSYCNSGKTSLCKFNSQTLKCYSTSCSYTEPTAVKGTDYYWTNVKASQADIYIRFRNQDSDNCCFHGNAKIEVRKNVGYPNGCGTWKNGDLYCDLSGNCDCTVKSTTYPISIGSPTEYVITATFVSQTSGNYHFDVYYEGLKYTPQSDDVYLLGGGSTTTTTTISSRCGESCYTHTCNKCEVCDYTLGVCVPAENQNIVCGCDNCYDTVPPNTGGCACKNGACVENYAEECAEKGYVGFACKCRPRENWYIYLDEDGCLQTGCPWPLYWYPREAACRCAEGCGATCGTNTDGSIKYCKQNEKCKFVQDTSGGDTAQGHCECYTPPLASGETNCADGIDNDGDCLVDCADPDCCAKSGPGGVICCAGANPDACCPVNGADGLTKGKCRSPSGTGGTPYDYTCVWPPCATNADCKEGGSCCTADPKGPNPGGTGVCVSKGIYSANKKYLCDPPGWSSKEVETETKAQNIFELILVSISHLFFQR